MAEAAGLTLGAVALASMFSTCIDLFDRFESGRNHAKDFHLACTKVRLLKIRLLKWGHILDIEAPGSEHAALKPCWSEERDVISRSLFGIENLFECAFVLLERQRLTSARSRTFSFFAWRPKT